MKPIYLVRPIRRSFDFKGKTGRAECFMYTAVNLALIAGVITVLPPLHLAVAGATHSPLLADLAGLALLALVQLPMVALSARRLRDQYAHPITLIWFVAVPFVGAFILFCYGFVPTFQERFLQLSDGSTVLASEYKRSRKLRKRLRAADVAVVGVSTPAEAGGSSGNGGPGTPLSPNASSRTSA